MRLTEEEKRIADEVAMHWAYALEKIDDAWAGASAYIAARRKAFGEAESDASVEVASGGRVIPPEGVEYRGPDLRGQAVIVDGSVIGGFTFTGPFDTVEAASEWHATKTMAGHLRLPATIVLLEKPKQEVFEDCPASAGCPPPENAAKQETPGTATAAGVAAPRGVVVTEAQYWAIKRAASILRRLGYHDGREFDPRPAAEARSLDDLLAAIDAAKGGA